MLDERKMQVLRAITTDYVASREPVGSKVLVERYQFGVPPATVRSDVAVLEEEGYTAQPHVSAGRIPTDRGYRFFADKLTTIKPLSAAERRAISTLMTGVLDVDDLATHTVHLLAQLAHRVAIAQYPSTQCNITAHTELMQLTPGRLLVMVVSSTGRVDQQILEFPGPEPKAVHLANLRLREAAIGHTAADTVNHMVAILDELDPTRRAQLNPVFAVTFELFGAESTAQVLVAGVPSLTGYSFIMRLHPLLEALEKQVVLLRSLDKAVSDGVTVRIGAENTAEGSKSTSLATTGYSVGSEHTASFGVVGSIHMDYSSTAVSIRAVARYVNCILTEDWALSEGYYGILGADKNATTGQIKKAYRRKAVRVYPDVVQDEDAIERFRELSETYEVLSDPSKRTVYDQGGDPLGCNNTGGTGGFGGTGFGGFSFSTIMDAILGGQTAGRGP